ncbi:MAG TPA: hydroxysqualene dehydroxylase HpnE [Acidimicrobiales bacterium]|nr:hydroxysqualene dehydroxylase HpnE [Acidimicrobiales bacterium]
MSERRVVVVGGGLAGVSAALTLADAGADVTLVEARRRLGGLTWSFSRKGLSFDNGQHVFLRCCTAYREFLTRIGAEADVRLQRSLEVPVLSPRGIRASITRSSLPAPLHLALALARYRHLALADRLGLFRAALALRRLDPDDPTLDDITFGSWLRRQRQSDQSVQKLWNLIALPTLNLPASEASLALAVKVFRTGLLDQADAGDIGWSAVPLSDLHGGHGGRALHAAGVERLLGARVKAISIRRDGTFVVTSSNREHLADAVVVATPPQVTRRLVPTAMVPSEALFGRSPIANVHLVLDRRVTDLAFAAVVDSPIQFVFDRTESSGLRTGQCLSISLSAADAYMAQPSEQLVRTFFAALQSLYPLARPARLLDGLVTRERAATFRGVPGTAALRPSCRRAVAGRPGLYLAGAWCDTGWPDTMEGAVRSGQSAAAACLEDAAVSSLTRRPEPVSS